MHISHSLFLMIRMILWQISIYFFGKRFHAQILPHAYSIVFIYFSSR